MSVLLVAAFGAFLAFLDATIVNVAFPDIRRSFPGSSFGGLSWVLNSYNIVFAAFLVAAGRLSDLLGRRRVFVVGVAVFTLASVACAAAETVGELIAFRVVQGFGAALLVPASLTLVVQRFPAARRRQAIALWGAAALVAAGLGPPAGGALVDLASWRAVFLVNLPLGLVAVTAARRVLIESRVAGHRRLPDLRGAVLLAAGLSLLNLALVEGSDRGWDRPIILASFAGCAISLAGYVVSSRRHRRAGVDPSLVQVRSFAVANTATLIAGIGLYAYLLTHVLFLSYVWHYSLLRTGLAVAPAAFVAAAVAGVLGRVADPRVHRTVVALGAFVWAASFGWYLARVGSDPDFLRAWLPGQVLSGIGVGATLPMLAGAALAGLPTRGANATAAAAVTSTRQLGAVLGIAILVVLFGHPAPLQVEAALRRGWMLSMVCFLATSVVALLLGRTASATAAPETDGEQLEAQREPAAPRPEPAIAPATADTDPLAELPLFRGLTPDARAALTDRAHDIVLDAGRYLFHEGEPSDALYVVRSGRLQVVRHEAVLTELGRGAVLGELGLLTAEPRSASIRGVRDSRLVRLDREHFLELADLPMMTALATGLARRLQEIEPAATRPTRSDPAVVAVVGLDPAAPAPDVSAGLLAHLRRFLVVSDPHRVDAEALERAEQASDLVLLHATSSDAEWLDFCLRVADRVIVVAGNPEPPDLPPYPGAVGADLVLAGRSASREQRIAWEKLLEPLSTHQLSAGDRDRGLRPLADRLAGRSLGLVLGGGGARAFAHLGVLDELQAAGIAVDRVAGSSVGAVIAGFHACGMDADEVDANVYEQFVRRNPVGDYTLPTKALIRGQATVSGLYDAFGGRVIEELPKEFRCVSVDLLARSAIVHRRGRLAEALACSLRLPGLYPPYLLDGRLHVDGGVLDNLPVRTLSRAEGPLAAVSIPFGGSGSRRSDTARTGAPRTPRIPTLPDTLMRTMMISAGAAARESMALADVVITPDVSDVGLLEFHQIDVLREAGRAAARAALPQITAALAARRSRSARSPSDRG